MVDDAVLSLVGAMDLKVEAAGVEMYFEDDTRSAVCLLLVVEAIVEGEIVIANMSEYFFILTSIVDLIVSKEDSIELSDDSSEWLHVSTLPFSIFDASAFMLSTSSTVLAMEVK